MNPSNKTTIGNTVTIKKGKKHTVVETPSSSSKRLIGIEDLRSDDLIRYTDDKSGTDAVITDVLIAWDGANAGTVGYGKTGFIGSTIARLRPKEKKQLDTSFLGIFLQSKFDYLKKIATGATIPHINRKALESIVLPNISLDDQKRIALLLGKVEGLTTKRKQHLQQIDDLLKSIFLDMFGDPVSNKKGWEIEPLSNLLTLQPNNGLYKPQSAYGTGTKIIRIDSFYDGYVQGIENLKRVKISNTEYEKYCVKSDDILVNRVNSIEYLGKLGIVPKITEPMVYESNIMKFQLNKNAILPVFLLFTWKLPFLKSQIIKRAKKAVNQASINQKDVLSFLIPKPPITLQNKFATIVTKVEGIKSLYQQSLTDLEHLYGALSQKAFKGEQDLSQIPLPKEAPEMTTEEKLATEDKPLEEPSFELPAPVNLSVLQSPESRKTLLNQWITAWLKQSRQADFTPQDFMEAARQRLWDLAEDGAPDWGAAEYDELKAWVFKALEQGGLTQTYDDADNRVRLSSAKG